MVIEANTTKEYLLRGKEFLSKVKKDQKWLYYSLLGSFGLIVLLNYVFPDVYWIGKKPMHDVKNGFMGLILTFFGCAFLLNALFFRSIVKGTFGYYLLTWFIGVVLCIGFLYFGLPLFLGF